MPQRASVELRAIIPAGSAKPPRTGCSYAVTVGSRPVASLGPIRGMLAAVAIVQAARGREAPVYGSYAVLKLVHGEVVHIGRVRWREPDIERWIDHSLARLATLHTVEEIRAALPAPALATRATAPRRRRELAA